MEWGRANYSLSRSNRSLYPSMTYMAQTCCAKKLLSPQKRRKIKTITKAPTQVVGERLEKWVNGSLFGWPTA